MQSKAVLRLARVSPQKARLVADLVRGKDVSEAIEMLQFSKKKSAGMIRKLIESAIANAEHKAERDSVALDIDDLFIKEIFVDQDAKDRREAERILRDALFKEKLDEM